MNLQAEGGGSKMNGTGFARHSRTSIREEHIFPAYQTIPFLECFEIAPSLRPLGIRSAGTRCLDVLRKCH